MATERLQVLLQLEAGQYKREAREAASATDRIAQEAQKAGSATGVMRDRITGVGTAARVALAGAAVLAFAGSAIAAARDLGESQNAVNKVFRDGADIIHQYGQVSAQTAGLSTREFNQLATSTGALLTNMGFGFEEAARQSVRLTTRAGDLASVFNTDVGDALEAINAGLRGETEPLRRFGISLSDTEILAKAVELGLAETTAEVDRHGKAVAALELVYEQSASAQGDFLQTSSELANAQRISAAEAENAQARLGQALVAPTTALQNLASQTLLSVQALGAFGDANATLARQSLRVQEAVGGINKAIREGGDQYTALADGLLHIAENGELSRGIFEALAAQAGLMPDQFEAFREIILRQTEAADVDAEVLTELEAALAETEDAAPGAAAGIEDVGDAADDTAGEVRSATEAQRELQLAYLEAANPIFAAQRALDRYRTAQETLTKVQEDGESTASDIAAATLDVASAALEAEGAMTELADGNIAAGVSAIADALGLSDDEARDLLETLGILNGTEVTTVVNTEFRTRGVPPRDRFGSIDTSTRVVSGVRQHGGPVAAFRPYLVGEAGTEMFIPSQPGFVFSNRDTRALIAALSGRAAGQIDIHLEGTGEPLIDAQRVGAVASVMRRMETFR